MFYYYVSLESALCDIGFMDWSDLWAAMPSCDSLPFLKACQMD